MMCIRTFLYRPAEKKQSLERLCLVAQAVSYVREALCSHPRFSFSTVWYFTSCYDNTVSLLLFGIVCVCVCVLHCPETRSHGKILNCKMMKAFLCHRIDCIQSQWVLLKTWTNHRRTVHRRQTKVQ